MKMKNLLMTTIAIFGLALFANAQVPNYIPTNGLVGWWPFNGNANDESGNGYNGTVDGASLVTDRFGGTNSAYIFDGINDYIFVSNIPDFVSYSGITISCWFKTQIHSNAGLVDRMDYVSGHRVSLRNADPIFDYDKKVWASSGNFYTNTRANSSSQYLLGQWNHVVASFSDSIRIYINATLEQTASLPNNQGNAGVLSFGRSLPDVPEYLDGILDDIGIWNRALTPQEITELFNAINCANNTAISPQINSLITGSIATFTATTSDPNPNFIWQSDLGQGFQTLNNFGNYSGANSATLNIANVQLSEHNQPIRVISTSGECIDTSNVAIINITDTCIVTINDTITTLISVTDTLIINALITGLTPPNNSNTIKVFPNPANNHITIDFGNFASMNGFTLKITNSIGQIVFTTSIDQQSSYIDLSTWSGNGIYFVQIIDSQNNTIENRKIVLQ